MKIMQDSRAACRDAGLAGKPGSVVNFSTKRKETLNRERSLVRGSCTALIFQVSCPGREYVPEKQKGRGTWNSSAVSFHETLSLLNILLVLVIIGNIPIQEIELCGKETTSWQEGIYSGVNVFAQKLATGIVLGIVGPLLAWSGYVEGTETQSETAITTIRLLMGLLPAFFLTLACVVAWYYPLTRKRHTEMLEKLALRRSRKGIEND